MAQLGRAAAGALALALALVGRHGAAVSVKPKPREHFLTNSELSDTQTIACLEAKKKDAGVECATLATGNSTARAFDGELSAGNYPSYKDVACGSGGEFFCDPSRVLSNQERLEIAAELTRLRRANPVSCPSLQRDPIDPGHLQPFYLGVMVAKDWPSSQTDPESLHQLGQIIESQWNMNELYNGQPVPTLKQCANTGMLIVMADKRVAYLSTGSCQFICQGEGSSQVVSRTLSSLDTKGTAAGVLAGIDEVYRRVSVAEASPKVDAAPPATGADAERRTDPWLNPLLQVFFAVAIVFIIVAVLGAAMVMLLAPGLVIARKKLPVL